jgi:phosphate transport system ATP-binding protein
MTRAGSAAAPALIELERLDVSYGGVRVVRGVTLSIRAGEILAIIGPAGSGKTTLLRTLNRLDADRPDLAISGRMTFAGHDVLHPEADVASLRRRVGMVFATPVPLPGSIFDNVAMGLRLAGMRDEAAVAARVEEALAAAFLWDEVKDRLRDSALTLSGGQSQRLCLARALALKPDVLLLDEPCSSLDPVSTAKIEEALKGLKAQRAVVLVTNVVAQAARVSDRTAMLLGGELIECGPTSKVFTNPADRRTEDYITGRFG